MDSASNNFSYTAGGIALGGSLFAVVRWAKNRLPATQIKDLDGVLQETRHEYTKSDEEGLLPDDFKDDMGPKLAELERLREKARERTYRAITMFDQVLASLQGLSKEIALLSDNAKVLRAEVVTKSEESRRMREARHIVPLPPTNRRIPTPDVTFPAGPKCVAPTTYVEASISETRVQVNEPAVPPSVYCQPCSSQATLVQPITYISAAPPSYRWKSEDHGRARAAPPHWYTFTRWSRMWDGRSSSEQIPTDIEAGVRYTDTSI